MFLKTNKKEKRFWLKKKKRFVAYRLIQLFFVFFVLRIYKLIQPVAQVHNKKHKKFSQRHNS